MIRGSIVAVFLISAVAFAQQPLPAPATVTTAIDADSRQTRDELRSLLHRYPPEVGAVLKLDPTLFDNQGYLANYPALAAFVGQHPEVAHNPGFFLQSVGVPLERDEPASLRIWKEILGDIGGFVIFLVFVSVLIWAIKTLIEQRRWSRLTSIQTEVHSKLLDRFTSNEELLAYIQSPSGRRFLQSAPIPLEAGPRPFSAPVGRIFWSLQAGLVVAAAGFGFLTGSHQFPSPVSQTFFAIGVIGLCVGIAFVLSAIVFYGLSRRFGLWEPAAVIAAGEGE